MKLSQKKLLGAILTLGLLVGTAQSAPYSNAPEPHYRGNPYGYGNPYGGYQRNDFVHGFCFSQRTGECSSIFSRQSEMAISQECRSQGWHRYYFFDHHHQAERAYNQVCHG